MFWDSSALVPYLAAETWSAEGTSLLGADHDPALWWATPVECISAIERRRRDGQLADQAYEEARRRLFDLMDRVDLIEAHPTCRDRAIRLLAVHPLRAADALQLAAAIVFSGEQPPGTRFVCLDERLRAAARAEGFPLLPQAVP